MKRIHENLRHVLQRQRIVFWLPRMSASESVAL